MKNKLLLDRLSPYIAPHRHFDLVLSKYGPVYVYPADRGETCHEAQVLDEYLEIIHTVAFQMVCDEMGPDIGKRVYPTEAELDAVRLRLLHLLSGLPFEQECVEILEQYIQQYEREIAAP